MSLRARLSRPQPGWRRIAIGLLAMAGPVSAGAQTLAFPGAEGFGRFATGGRGGDVYVVTNLNNSGAGSLREGVTNRVVTTPRTVVFGVSGTIYLESTLRITKGNLTIAGQTAPGDGICLAYRPLDISNSTNVIIRFLRVRLGDVAGVENDAFSSRYGSNLIIDHCSFSWSVDETSSTYDNTNLTLQWCMITESLRDSVHSKGAHGYGGIWGGLGATYHHNLIAHHDSRNPRFNGARTHGTAGELVDMRNNVIYNWRGNSTYGGEPTDAGIPARHNMVNNTYKNGPATSASSAVRYRIVEPSRNTVSTGSTLSLFHVSGNHTTASAAVTADNWNGGVQVIPSSEFASIRVDTPFEAPAVVTQTAQSSYSLVLAHSGCRLPARDSVDTRIVSEVANGTATYRGSKGNLAGILDSQADVGGWPALASTPAPADADADGMPDAWETARGLNPNNSSDRNLIDADGYTNLELYLNELAAPAFPSPVIGTQPQPVTVFAGGSFTLSVAASGFGPLAYQWYRGATPIEGATAASHTINPAALADDGEYRVVVRNDYVQVASAPVRATVLALSPLIGADPLPLTVAAGGNATFTVVAAGQAPLGYQWYRGVTPLVGATAATLTLPSISPAAAGAYHVVVTNAHGAAVSGAATLTVSGPAVSANPFEEFVVAHGLHADPLAAAADADPDGDGLANAFEFVFGGDPLDGGSAPRPMLATIPDGDSSVVFTFVRHVGALAALDLAVERSDDLSDWVAVTDGIGGASVLSAPLDETRETVTVQAPLDGPKAFFRLRATPR